MLSATLVKLDAFTITPQPVQAGAAIRFNVDRNGRPFAQIWTFKAKGERHPYHAQTLAGAYATFPTYAKAEAFVRGEA